MILRRNPEFQKQVWLSLTPNRMMIMPSLLAVVFLIVYLASDDMVTFLEALRPTVLIVLAILMFLLGLKDVSDAVISEVQGHTWDSQRMTSIGPWEMVMGKLIGGAVYAWYGALFCIAVSVAAAWLLPGTAQYIKLLLIVLIAAVMCHAASLCLIMVSIRKNRYGTNFKSSSYPVLILAAAMLFGIIMQVAMATELGKMAIPWYGWRFSWSTFILISGIFFLIWSIVGFWRNMRLELQFTNGPWVWVLFLVTLMLYSGGFASSQVVPDLQERWLVRLYLGLVIALFFTYIMAFNEPKELVAFKKLLARIREKQYKALQKELSLWLVSLGVAVCMGVATLIVAVYIAASGYEIAIVMPVWYPLTLILFLLRDMCLLLYLNIKPNAARADVFAVICLLVLYVVIPIILMLLKAERLMPVFVPTFEDPAKIGIMAVTAQAALGVWLLKQRWQKINPDI